VLAADSLSLDWDIRNRTAVRVGNDTGNRAETVGLCEGTSRQNAYAERDNRPDHPFSIAGTMLPGHPAATILRSLDFTQTPNFKK